LLSLRQSTIQFFGDAIAPDSSFPDTDPQVNRTGCWVRSWKDNSMTMHHNAPVIVVAMPSEMRQALDEVESPERHQLGPWVRWSARLDGQPVNLVLSGIGMVNAGASLARCLADLKPSCVLNFGCAGAHRADMNPGDVVIGTRYVHHRAVIITPTGEETAIGTAVSPEQSSSFVDSFEADPTLLAAARSAVLDWRPDRWPWATNDEDPIVHAGPLTSADTWTQQTSLLEEIHTRHGTFCEDMEAAALAQVSSMHGLPFLSIKDISNNEFHTATVHDAEGAPTLDDVAEEVGRRAFALLRRALEKL
jgi:adenosylhomocysteine nucleosidase